MGGEIMRTSKLGFAVAVLAVAGTLAVAEDKPVVGIVSISATEANNEIGRAHV